MLEAFLVFIYKAHFSYIWSKATAFHSYIIPIHYYQHNLRYITVGDCGNTVA